MTHDVFISYSSKDKTVADAVCAKLEEQKIRCWIAPRDIPAGQNFARSIINAINDSRVLVLLWSASANTSEHILNEINQAFDQGVTIIPFRIQDVQPTPEMRYYFGRTHWLDALNPPLEKHILTLAETISAILRSKSEPAPAEKFQPPPEKKPESAPVVKAEPAPAAEKPQRHTPAPPPRKIPLIPILVSVGVLALLTVGYFSGWLEGLFQSRPAQEPVVTEASPPAASQTPALPTATPEPTPTITPFPAWVAEIADPILLAVSQAEPVFEDDFSWEGELYNHNWQFQKDGADCPDQPYYGIVDGKMMLSNNTQCFVHLTPFINNVPNYVLQLDLGGMNPSGTRINIRAGDNSLQLNSNGGWTWSFHDTQNATSQMLGEGMLDFDPAAAHTLTLIGYQNWNAVYLDGIPLVSGENAYRTADQFFQISLFGGNQNQYLEFDNLKVWNLDSLTGLPEVTT